MMIQNYPQTPPRAAARVVALGFFDGVHLGHREVLRRAAEQTGAGETAAAFTFDTLPKLAQAERLTDEAELAQQMARLGIEELWVARFADICDLPPEAFVRRVLREQFGARAVVCGYNYRFGKGGTGNADMLRALCAAQGIAVTVVPPVTADGEPVSATRIRAAVRAGDLRTANRLLGRPLTIRSRVMAGQQLGRQLGTPTINQPLPAGLTLPAFGVYASAVEVEGRVTYGVTNIGVRPTVGGGQPLAETWIPAFEGDLYGQAVPVTPVRFLRPERKFPSVEALQAQIEADGETARRLFFGEDDAPARAVLFDFDDTLQDRPAAFLSFSRAFVRAHFPSLSPAEQEARAAEMARLNGNGYVKYESYIEQLKTRFDWRDAPDTAALIAEIQREFPLHTTLLPGVSQGLRTLRAHGWLIGVVTNGLSVMQNKKLDVSGLRPLLDGAVVSGDEGIHKPDPEIFRRAAARLGVAASRCVFVGDHPVNDIEGARAAGMRPVFMQASGRFSPPDGVPRVHSMAELAAWLETEEPN